MVDNEKIVVILLLVTIILSVLSVVVTLGLDTSNNVREVRTTQVISGNSEGAGNVALVVNPSTGGSG